MGVVVEFGFQAGEGIFDENAPTEFSLLIRVFSVFSVCSMVILQARTTERTDRTEQSGKRPSSVSK
jgi:hypothetical protein